jgi:hypothetical protein
MALFDRYPCLWSLFKSFRRSQAKTLVLVITAMVEAGVVGSLGLAQRLAMHLDVRVDSALNRFYRLLRNPRFETEALSEALLKGLSEKPGDVVIAVDWTEWVRNMRVLVAAVIAGTRAIPVASATHLKSTFLRSQNAFENDFLLRLHATLGRLGIRATVLADRGFRRASLLRLLTQWEQPFVVRLMSDVSVLARGRWVRLGNFHLNPGQAVDLGVVCLGQNRASRIHVRVVGVHALGAKETWWLATSEDHSVSHVVALYDRRMGVEEQFRDTKGARFGLQMQWTQFQKEEHIDRVFLLAGVVLFVLIAIGRLVSRSRPDVRFHHPQKGPRQSYFTIALVWATSLSDRLRLDIQTVGNAVPRPHYRHFPWIRDGLISPDTLLCEPSSSQSANREVEPMQN